MQFSIDKESIVDALTPIVNLIPSRPIADYASCVLMTLNGPNLRLQATDVNSAVTFKTTLADMASVDGVILVRGKPLLEVLKRIPGDRNVTFAVDQGERRNLSIVAGRARFKLALDDPGIFVAPFHSGVSSTFRATSAAFLNALQRTSYAQSREDGRAYLCGTFVELTTSGARLVSTDGHRLSYCPVAGKVDGERSVIIPRESAGYLAKILSGDMGEISITLMDGYAIFETSSYRYETRLIDGTFPDYERLTPPEFRFEISFEHSELAKSIAMLCAISDDKSKAIRFEFHSDRAEVDLSGQSQADEGKDTLSADVLSAPENLVIGFNGKYLTDMLSSLPGDIVTFRMNESGSPAHIVTEMNDGSYSIIMPMRVG